MHPYFPILLFGCLAFGIGAGLVGLSRLRTRRLSQDSEESRGTYECGFEPFEEARFRFDIRFYLVSILFIIFDLEITLLFPWALSLHNIGFLGFCSMMLFLSILTIGFIYEWRKGALDWE